MEKLLGNYGHDLHKEFNELDDAEKESLNGFMDGYIEVTEREAKECKDKKRKKRLEEIVKRAKYRSAIMNHKD